LVSESGHYKSWVCQLNYISVILKYQFVVLLYYPLRYSIWKFELHFFLILQLLLNTVKCIYLQTTCTQLILVVNSRRQTNDWFFSSVFKCKRWPQRSEKRFV